MCCMRACHLGHLRSMISHMSESTKAQGRKEAGEPSFEEALEKLRGIVEGMEEGSLSLEEMIKRYEQGVELASLCSKSLAAAEERVRLIAENSGANPRLLPLDGGAEGIEADEPQDA